MKRFVRGLDRGQSTLFPECLEDWVGADNPVRVIEVFVDELDLGRDLAFAAGDEVGKSGQESSRFQVSPKRDYPIIRILLFVFVPGERNTYLCSRMRIMFNVKTVVSMKNLIAS